MARRPVSMHKTKEILRLKHELGLTNRQIAASLNLSHTCVGQHLRCPDYRDIPLTVVRDGSWWIKCEPSHE